MCGESDVEKIPVWAFWPEELGSPMIVDDPETIAECFLKYMENGERIIIERREMTRTELQNLPEHVGW